MVLLAFMLVTTLPMGYADNKQKIRELQGKTQSIKAKAAEMRRKKYEKMRAAQRMNQNIAVNQQRLEMERRSLQFHEQRLGYTKDRLVYLDNRLDATMGDAVRLGQDAGRCRAQCRRARSGGPHGHVHVLAAAERAGRVAGASRPALFPKAWGDRDLWPGRKIALRSPFSCTCPFLGDTDGRCSRCRFRHPERTGHPRR